VHKAVPVAAGVLAGARQAVALLVAEVREELRAAGRQAEAPRAVDRTVVVKTAVDRTAAERPVGAVGRPEARPVAAHRVAERPVVAGPVDLPADLRPLEAEQAAEASKVAERPAAAVAAP
jgi:hypothetical protein